MCLRLSQTVGNKAWHALDTDTQCLLFAMMLQGCMGEGVRVPLLLENMTSTENWKPLPEHTNVLPVEQLLTGINCTAVQDGDPHRNALMRKYIYKLLEVIKRKAHVEDRNGELTYRETICTLKINELTGYLALCCILTGLENLNKSDVRIVN